ncbi:2-oxoglutarate dehydrogenase E1 component, partial [Pseudomonas aeruginosa]
LQFCSVQYFCVCVPTTPAQVCHMLRRQGTRPPRKPLVVMTPKAPLRHKPATSTLEDLATGSFQTVTPEIDSLASTKVYRVVLCSGKVSYDLLEKRREEGRADTAIVRIAPLSPFPEDDLAEVLAPYTHLKHIVWC